jgi:hypothetical protein
MSGLVPDSEIIVCLFYFFSNLVNEKHELEAKGYGFYGIIVLGRCHFKLHHDIVVL